ncbi:MAG: aconitase family protein [Candidatus Levybacteria bacterium]|nr:aconitase family protein [Candidatus Levybacteria bacterium]
MSTETLFQPDFEPQKEEFQLTGRILYLTVDPDLIRQQLDGENIPIPLASDLAFGVSTDELAPNRICLQYTGHEEDLLGNNLLTGFRGGVIKSGEILNGNFEAIVAGPSFGRGSSRYHAPIALQEAGIKVLITEPAERIFSENAVNAGINILHPESEAAQILLEENRIPLSKLREHLPPISREIINAGSLLKYLQMLHEGKFSYPVPKQQQRPMTMAEKMITRKVKTGSNSVGVSYVKPGDQVIAIPDMYYGYELQTTVVRRALTDEFGDEIPVSNPDKTILFNDHTALIQNTEAAQTQQKEQKVFADQHGIINFENDDSGSEAICHTKMLEDFALPNQLILGNDSHTCTLGAVNTLAVGKGAADLAGAIAFDEMVIQVPETVRVNVVGKLRSGATIKDAVLALGARDDMKDGRLASGRVLEFGGEALNNILFDEQIKFTNMAVELQAFTGILEPNIQMFQYLNEKRGMTLREFSEQMVISDDSAEYASTLTLDLSTVEPMVATPGDTQNGVKLSEITKQKIKIQKAYIGSCTHGTPEDLRQGAEVTKGRKICETTKLYVQASSQGNLQTAEEYGYIQTLLDAGAELLPIGCGACMNAGPGSTEEGEVGIFATNRNYPGRTGKGETYLSNPKVVAASAIAGFICGPEDLENNYTA